MCIEVKSKPTEAIPDMTKDESSIGSSELIASVELPQTGEGVRYFAGI